jgi:hypothetical protein
VSPWQLMSLFVLWWYCHWRTPFICNGGFVTDYFQGCPWQNHILLKPVWFECPLQLQEISIYIHLQDRCVKFNICCCEEMMMMKGCTIIPLLPDPWTYLFTNALDVPSQSFHSQDTHWVIVDVYRVCSIHSQDTHWVIVDVYRVCSIRASEEVKTGEYKTHVSNQGSHASQSSLFLSSWLVVLFSKKLNMFLCISAKKSG